VQTGDQLLSLDGVRPKDANEAISMIRKHAPGEKMKWYCGGNRRRLRPWRLWGARDVNGGMKAAYYDCSPGGEDLIGWHVNRGKDEAADFFPAAKFREQFTARDVIQQVLAKGDVTAALLAANEATDARRRPPWRWKRWSRRWPRRRSNWRSGAPEAKSPFPRTH